MDELVIPGDASTSDIAAPTRRRTLRRLVLLVIAGGLALAAVATSFSSNTKPSSVPFQAGETWCCGTSEVAASWVVPPLPRPPEYEQNTLGAWIGVQTGNGKKFFFQVGTTEWDAGTAHNYWAFWSAAIYDYQPKYFPRFVSPGDLVHAEILQTGSRWVATFTDVTARWSLSESIRASTNQDQATAAEWLEEDVVVYGGHLPTSVNHVTEAPRTTCSLTFKNLELNGGSFSWVGGPSTSQSFVDASGTTYKPEWNDLGSEFTVWEQPRGGEQLRACSS
jgi:hypothetical protein